MKRPVDIQPVAASVVPSLTANQLRIAQLFAAMDDRRQEEALTKMARMAAHYPRRARPVLSLVQGGAR